MKSAHTPPGCQIDSISALASVTPDPATSLAGELPIPLAAGDVALTGFPGVTLATPTLPAGVRGPQVMRGYWQRPEETASTIDADGWLMTGDIGVMDARGYVRLIDRKKDMILVSGFNVYPNEIEDVVMLHPGVREAAVVGVPDPIAGERVKLVVVARDPQLDADAILAFAGSTPVPGSASRSTKSYSAGLIASPSFSIMFDMASVRYACARPPHYQMASRSRQRIQAKVQGTDAELARQCGMIQGQ